MKVWNLLEIMRLQKHWDCGFASNDLTKISIGQGQGQGQGQDSFQDKFFNSLVLMSYLCLVSVEN